MLCYLDGYGPVVGTVDGQPVCGECATIAEDSGYEVDSDGYEVEDDEDADGDISGT